ncbi:uncharacterized protein LOC124153859 [Ischnura elegans]|uniref:uncharacterized protein LOC124153859 n=1 Tax=Ischnura elegans TaxID=197161 RepID=UPI001ED8896C|nr:uncharacterized protein LOC124153859 [Ischnura elegans]
MKLLIILGLAVAAVAASTLTPPELVRLGSIGVAIVDVKGELVPKKDSTSAVPVFEFKSNEPWAATEHDSEYFTYRCNVITEYFNPKSTQPILLCRNVDFNKGSKQAFLFTHGGLSLEPSVKEIEVVVGKTTVANFTAMHSINTMVKRRKPAMEGVYDGFHFYESSESILHSLLDYNI